MMWPIRRSPLSIMLPAFWVLLAAGSPLREAAADDSAAGSVGRWVDWRVTGPIVCRAEFPLKPLEGLLGELAQLQTDLVRSLGVPPAREPIELFLFRDKAGYSRYIKRHLPGVPFRRALFVKSQGVGRVFAYRNRELAVDVRHECTHALLHAALPVVPLWLDEGLAEYFEVPARQRAFDNPHLSSLRWSLLLGKPQDLRVLEKLRDLSSMGKNEYRSAWAWVHFLLHGPKEAHDELVRYLRDIQAGAPPGLFSERLQRRVVNPKHRLTAHLRSFRR